MVLEDLRQDRAGRVLRQAAPPPFQHGSVPMGDPDLALVVQHSWWVRWQRAERTPWTQEVLGDPAVHLTVESSGPISTVTHRPPPIHGMEMPAALVHGPVTRLWTVELPLSGRVSGIAFRPGGLAALLDVDVSRLTDRVVPAGALLGPQAASDLRDAVLADDDEERRAATLLDLVRERLGREGDRVAADHAYRAVREAVALMAARERPCTRLEEVAAAVHCSPRSLQRWFHRYVGLSPLQVLRRHRLQDAIAAVEAGEPDLAGLAVRLGWADHAHLTREFTTVLGRPPEAYRSTAADAG